MKPEYRCKGCGKDVVEKDVEKLDRGLCHLVPYGSNESGWEPEPCGPVLKILEVEND